MSGFSPLNATIVLLLINFFAHYMFASVTAHVTALIPVLLAVGSSSASWASSHPTAPVQARSTTAAVIYLRRITGDSAPSLD
jgi:di/tricarboxylate transporter